MHSLHMHFSIPKSPIIPISQMKVKSTGPWNQHWRQIQPYSQTITIHLVDLASVIILGGGGVSMGVPGGRKCVWGEGW